MGGGRSDLKVIFFGTPDYVLPILEALHKTYNVNSKERQFIAVVTQEPKAVGREKKITRSEVDHWAYKHKVDIYYDLEKVPEADLGIVAAYGRIIPKSLIAKFKYGLLNIHPSLLPKYRGASPIQATLLSGDTQTGVSVIKMDELVDHGPLISQFREDVFPSDTNETLRTRLFERSAEFLIELIPHYISGKIKPKDQDHERATFTKTITKQDGFIPPTEIKAAMEGKDTTSSWKIGFLPDLEITDLSEFLDRFSRAMLPWPGIWTTVKIKGEAVRLKILQAETKNHIFTPITVQLEGKNAVTWSQFKLGHPDFRLD